MSKPLFDIGSRVRGMDERCGVVRGISKDGGQFRWIAWEDGSEGRAAVESLRPAADGGQRDAGD